MVYTCIYIIILALYTNVYYTYRMNGGLYNLLDLSTSPPVLFTPLLSLAHTNTHTHIWSDAHTCTVTCTCTHTQRESYIEIYERLTHVLTIGRYIKPSMGNIQLPSLKTVRSSKKPIVPFVGGVTMTEMMRLPKERVSARKEERLTMGDSLYRS